MVLPPKAPRVVLSCRFSCSPVSPSQSGPDNDPAAAQGYVDNTFHDSSFDSINEFNGQLTVPISVGPEYPVGPSLKLQLMLTYNSKVWDYGAPVPEDALGEWRPVAGDPALGIGWTFTPGKILPCGSFLQRVCFVRSDGAEIVFFPKTPIGGVNYWETQDTNPYRLSRVGSLGPYTMHDGDGLTYTFNHQVLDYDDKRTMSPGYTRDYGRGRDGWYLTEIRDLFGNRIEVEYWQNAASCPWHCSGGGNMNCVGSSNSWIPRYFRVQPIGQAEDLVAEVLTDSSSTKLVTTLKFKVHQGASETWVDWNLVYGDSTYNGGFSGLRLHGTQDPGSDRASNRHSRTGRRSAGAIRIHLLAEPGGCVRRSPEDDEVAHRRGRSVRLRQLSLLLGSPRQFPLVRLHRGKTAGQRDASPIAAHHERLGRICAPTSGACE